ncbi:hypothetical protein PRIPAC_96446, partial [Pristionchus pacificus]|uniref:Uncharacterized protein n=1 Tax=Pristionchus pacificus TaxID=54126 RepID=A0A2A6D2L4_PRIPA
MRSYKHVTARSELIDLFIISLALLTPPTPTRIFVYRFVDVADPYYVAVHEPNLCITPPINGHHRPTLEHLIDKLFNTILPQIAHDSAQFFLDSDKVMNW